MVSLAAGVDVAAGRVHVVVVAPVSNPTRGPSGDLVDGGGGSRGVEIVEAFVADAEGAAERLVAAGVSRVAVDAPDAPSVAFHAGDGDLSTKFRPARCGEIALGRERRIWVAWVTPSSPPFAGWMETGFVFHATLRASGVTTVETYPHAVYRTLAGGARVPSKSTVAGLAARVDALVGAGLAGDHLDMWGHDGLDAAAAALVAVDPDAVGVTCGHDGSAIWLPSAR